MEFKALRIIFKHMFKILLMGSLSIPAWAQTVQLTQGFVRAMPDTVPNTAAYFTLENHGEPQRLVSVTTDVAREAQLHTLLEEDGVVKMRQVTGYDVPKHGTLTLRPSGDHIMLLGLKAPLQLAQKVALTLHFESGQELKIELPVQKAEQTEANSEHHHHH